VKIFFAAIRVPGESTTGRLRLVARGGPCRDYITCCFWFWRKLLILLEELKELALLKGTVFVFR